MVSRRGLLRAGGAGLLGRHVFGARLGVAAGLMGESWPVGCELFLNGREGYRNYRIPSLIATVKGTLLAFCEGRPSADDSGDVDVVMKRSVDHGRTWSGLRVVADFGGDTIQNPTGVVDRTTGTIWMLMTSNAGDVDEKAILEGRSERGRTVWVTGSDDDGHTWSTAREITATTKLRQWTWYATGPGNGIQLRDGRLVVPCDHAERGSGEYSSHVIFSVDHGRTWQLGGSCGPGSNECAVAQLADGSLLLNMRNAGEGRHRLIARSRDEGMTWSTAVADAALVEPVCEASLIRVSGPGDSVLFANPASATRRERLTVRLSRDGGRTWFASRVLYEGPAAYSSLACLPDGTIGCLYERGRRDENEEISFARFPVSWVWGR